jgi:hypothetical protein
MSLSESHSQSSAKLPLTLAIGFTGHRQLPDESKSRETIRKVLEEWKAKVPGLVYGLSSAASGGDLLFAEACLEMNLPIRIFLPFPEKKFREDFDEPEWTRAEQVMARALSVEIKGVSDKPEQAYYECSIETVQQSELLIALWDGEKGRGMGGTADAVSFALELGRPVIWINSATAEVRYFNEKQDLLHDPEMDFLNGLRGETAVISTGSPQSLVQAWFSKIDENASRVAPQFRRLAAIPILCTAAAATLSASNAFQGERVIWLWMGTVFAVLAAALPVAMRLNRRQITWTRVRTAAEICRSSLALWHTPALYDVVGSEVIPDLAGMLTTLNFLKISDPASRQTTLDEFKQSYRRDRVQHQTNYFSRHATFAAKAVRRFKIFIWTVGILAGGFNVWILASRHGLPVWMPENWRPGLAFAAAVGFQITTVAGALLVVYDYQRRRDRYRELHRMLTQWDKQLDLAQTWPIVLRIASRVEKALLAELIEWRSHIKNQKLPQK